MQHVLGNRLINRGKRWVQHISCCRYITSGNRPAQLLIAVRTRVRFARFTSARCSDCAARFNTDFFFFFILVACPWAI
jgi:hypothetical protein